MIFVPIFESNYPREDCKLWSVHYPDERENEFDRLLEEWSDTEHLRNFFRNNNELLNTKFWNNMSINSASMKAAAEASSFEVDLLNMEKAKHENDPQKIKQLFRHIGGLEFAAYPNYLKGRADEHKPFFRFYAIQLQKDQICIVGGGIKLTKYMEDTPALEGQLVRFQTVDTYLKDNGILFLS